ncbi:hypothetical protein PAQ31011_00579 [Pandoraea aquatica]|uniref:Uncharacterized protein n=1 Tax=Pandoraea aquatica TaxID=2508290 RepID=A0A5E4S702_9BURK|nr:hypothetical protein [Pandoraea aquatica]VVD70572.1 hypothetical protein PAQ31011_00579 [Pandoraea aquatica]
MNLQMLDRMATTLSSPIRFLLQAGAFYCLVLVGLPVYALTGTDVAYLVNQRYQSTVAKCGVDRAAWQCSGVVMRPLSADSGLSFSQLSTDEVALQSVNVAYIRRDLRIAALATSAGMILADGFTAAGQGKAYEVRCTYPFAPPITQDVPSHGCNVAESGQPIPPDLSTCAASGVTDTAAWLADFKAHGEDVAKQCSLSATVARQFKASLEAHEQVSEALAAKPNRLLIVAWDPAKPATIPVQAFYYDVANGGQLMQAQRYQRQYFEATGQWLPILRASIGGAGGTAFGFDERDQLDYGIALVRKINARFAETSDCGAQPLYVCSGVIFRITGYGPTFHSWNNSPSSVTLDGVATVFMRTDSRTTVIPWGFGEGFVFDVIGAPTQTPLIPRCAYPADGYTNHRTNRCGQTSSPLSASCAGQGITTLAQWQTHFAQAKWTNQCSFGIDKAAFALMVAAHSSLPVPSVPKEHGWTELVFKPWPDDIPTQLPIQAIFFTPESLAGAQYIQRDYMDTTGRFLPILKLDIVGSPDAPFSYSVDDQGTAE